MFHFEGDMDQDGDVHSKSALVLYGSETGNAFDFAQELGRMTERIHFWTHVTTLDSIELVCRAHCLGFITLTLNSLSCPSIPLCWSSLRPLAKAIYQSMLASSGKAFSVASCRQPISAMFVSLPSDSETVPIQSTLRTRPLESYV